MTNDNILIQRYLDGELPDAERQAFDERIKLDADFAEEVETAAFVHAQYQLRRKKELAQLLKQQQAQNPKPPIQSRTRIVRLYRRIAVAVAVLLFISLGVYWSVQSSRADQLATAYLEVKHLSPELPRGLVDSLGQITEINETTLSNPNIPSLVKWKMAGIAYSNNRYETAIFAIEQCIKAGHAEAEQYFYLGLCRLYQTPPEYAQAILNLTRVVQTTNEFEEEARWYLGLVYLQVNQRDRAKIQLKKIVDNQHWKHQEARKLLEHL